jgi:hypothetical protein
MRAAISQLTPSSVSVFFRLMNFALEGGSHKRKQECVRGGTASKRVRPGVSRSETFMGSAGLEVGHPWAGTAPWPTQVSRTRSGPSTFCLSR